MATGMILIMTGTMVALITTGTMAGRSGRCLTDRRRRARAQFDRPGTSRPRRAQVRPGRCPPGTINVPARGHAERQGRPPRAARRTTTRSRVRLYVQVATGARMIEGSSPSVRRDGFGPMTLARTGGVLYLAIILLGICSEVFVRGRIVVAGDAEATAVNLAAMAPL